MTPEEAVDLAMAEPAPGSVVLLRIRYPESAVLYSYALLNVGDQWYITGAESKKSRTWMELIAWLQSKNADVVSIQRAATWENL